MRAAKKTISDWSVVGIKGYVMLMIEILKYSPTYELAHRIDKEKLSEDEWQDALFSMYADGITKKLTHKEKQSLLDDFDLVLKTYSEYGDISLEDSHRWWQEVGMKLYTADYNPNVAQIDRIDKAETAYERLHSALDTYLETTLVQQGKPPALILSVPLGMNKQFILNQVSDLIDQANVPVPPIAQKGKKTLTAERLRAEPLFMAMCLLMYKIQNPNMALWRLGVLANVSPKNAVGLNVNEKLNDDTIEQANRMAILTSRALKKARLLSENAAMGNFPSTENRKLPVFYCEYVQKNYQDALLYGGSTSRTRLRVKQEEIRKIIMANK